MCNQFLCSKYILRNFNPTEEGIHWIATKQTIGHVLPKGF